MPRQYSRHAQLPASMDSRRYVFLHRQPPAQAGKPLACPTYRCPAQRCGSGATAPSFHRAWLGRVAGSPALHSRITVRRCRFRITLAFDQAGVLEGASPGGTSFRCSRATRRAWHLATEILGTCHPGRGGLRVAHGLHSCKSGQARLGGARPGLAIFHVPPLGGAGNVSPGLDGWR